MKARWELVLLPPLVMSLVLLIASQLVFLKGSLQHDLGMGVMAPSQISVRLSGPLLEKISNRPKTLTTMVRNEDTTTAAISTIERPPSMRAIV